MTIFFSYQSKDKFLLLSAEGGAMFIAGMTGVAEPPVNDLWTVPGEENMLKEWNAVDNEIFNNIDPTVYYMQCQIEDFIDALKYKRDPLVTGEDGRRTVELITSIYRSSRDNLPVKFPLTAENDDIKKHNDIIS
jgi:predicted dehydrogenase